MHAIPALFLATHGWLFSRKSLASSLDRASQISGPAFAHSEILSGIVRHPAGVGVGAGAGVDKPFHITGLGVEDRVAAASLSSFTVTDDVSMCDDFRRHARYRIADCSPVFANDPGTAPGPWSFIGRYERQKNHSMLPPSDLSKSESPALALTALAGMVAELRRQAGR